MASFAFAVGPAGAETTALEPTFRGEIVSFGLADPLESERDARRADSELSGAGLSLDIGAVRELKSFFAIRVGVKADHTSTEFDQRHLGGAGGEVLRLAPRAALVARAAGFEVAGSAAIARTTTDELATSAELRAGRDLERGSIAATLVVVPRPNNERSRWGVELNASSHLADWLAAELEVFSHMPDAAADSEPSTSVAASVLVGGDSGPFARLGLRARDASALALLDASAGIRSDTAELAVTADNLLDTRWRESEVDRERGLTVFAAASLFY